MEEQLEFDFTDGKKREERTISKFELDELLGLGSVNPYGTLNEESFASKLDTMGIDDMRALAMRVGLTPINRPEELSKRLLNEFRSFISNHRHSSKESTSSINPNSEAYKSIEHLL